MKRWLLRDYQVLTLDGLLAAMQEPNAELTMMFPRQAGKNQVSAALVATLLRLNARRGGSIIVTAPTLQPQAIISRERTLEAIRDMNAPLGGRGASQVTVDGMRIRCGEASATFLSAQVGANVAGHTASIALIADEAQDIDEEWFDRQFRPMTASTGAPTLMFGTPWNGISLLERAVGRNREMDRRFEGKPGYRRRHHQVSWREVAKIVPAYGAHVAAQRERLGKDNPLYLSQYELVASERSGRLFRASALAAITGGHARMQAPAPGERYVGGLDFGGEGEHSDATVLTIGRLAEGGRVEVVAWVEWRGASSPLLVAEIPAELAHWRLERVHADSTGMGQPLVGMLQKQSGNVLHGVTFSSQSKSAMGRAMQTAVATGRLALPADDGSALWAKAMEEYGDCLAVLESGESLRWFAPAGQHDDFVASLALMLNAAEAAGPSRVAVGKRR